MATFTLTTGTDTVLGSAADDMVNATAATLNAGDSLAGGGGIDTLALVDSGTFHVDQLASFTGFEFVNGVGDNITVLIDNADTAGVQSFDAFTGLGDKLVTADGSLDLSHTTVKGFTVASTNASGTTFTVGDLATAFQVAGGLGHDTLIAQGLTLTAARRAEIFAINSIETITDQTGTYNAPAPSPDVKGLTPGNDTFVAPSSGSTVYATAATLNAGDSLTGGAGTDVLALVGKGTFHVDQLASFTGFERITLDNVSDPFDPFAQLYLGNQPIKVDVTGSLTVQVNSPSNWNGLDTINGDASSATTTLLFSNGQGGNPPPVTYDLTLATLSHVGVNANASNITLLINNADTAGVQSFNAFSGLVGDKLVTADGSLDLSHTTVSGFTVVSTNAVGTTFTVSDLYTAFQVAGGSGQDTLIAQGLTLTAAQRAEIFATNSIETIIDQTGTYNYPNIPPTITSNGGGDTAAVSIVENTTAVTTVTATDPDVGQTLSYSISGGVDAGKFTIDSTTGALSFITAPNFETPTDTGGNNVYDVIVQVSDVHAVDTQAIAVSVQHVVGASIHGTAGNDVIDMTHTVAGQPFPTAGDDTLNGGGGSDTLAGGPGADTFVFDQTALTPAQPGSGVVDHILDYNQGTSGIFNPAEGDTFDLSALLSAGSGQSVDHLVRVLESPSGSAAILQVDQDGAANGAHWTTIAQLDGVHTGDGVTVIFDASQPAATLTAPALVPTHNFNGDGNADILWQNANGTPAIWTMDGTNISGAAALANPGPTWHVAAAADFNGDGKSDILWQNDNGTPAIWTMDGTNITGGAALPNPGPTWHVEAAADFNGDGKADILWQNDSGTPAIWTMDGTNITGGAALPNPGPTWHVAAAADFNGDGKADILWQNANGTPAIWLMDGTNISGAAGPGSNPGPSWHDQGERRFQRRRQGRHPVAERQRDAGDLDRWMAPTSAVQRPCPILGLRGMSKRLLISTATARPIFFCTTIAGRRRSGPWMAPTSQTAPPCPIRDTTGT